MKSHLCNNSNGTENSEMSSKVMAVWDSEDFSLCRAPIDCLVVAVHARLHCLVLYRIDKASRVFYLTLCFTKVLIICLNMLIFI